MRGAPGTAAAVLAMVGRVDKMELEVVPVRVLPRDEPGALAVRNEAKTAAIAAAGGVLAGAVTVAAVRAVGAAAGRKKAVRRGFRRERPANVVASRSFLVDVHLLGR